VTLGWRAGHPVIFYLLIMGFQRDEGLSALVRVRGAEETVTGGWHASSGAAA
jgi:hypothetical protein